VLICNTAHLGDIGGLLRGEHALQTSPPVSRVGALTGSGGAEVLKMFAPEVARPLFDPSTLSRAGPGCDAFRQGRMVATWFWAFSDLLESAGNVGKRPSVNP
jgi:hypothetical protein